MFFGTFRQVAASVGWSMFLAAVLVGQSGTSTIAGLVTDATGASIPGVRVRAVNEDTGVVLETVTNAGVISSARPARTLQLGARLTF